MAELHADLHKQNQLHHPGKKNAQRYYIQWLKEDSEKHMMAVLQIFAGNKKTSRIFLALEGDKLIFAPMYFNICSSVTPP